MTVCVIVATECFLAYPAHVGLAILALHHLTPPSFQYGCFAFRTECSVQRIFLQPDLKADVFLLHAVDDLEHLTCDSVVILNMTCGAYVNVADVTTELSAIFAWTIHHWTVWSYAALVLPLVSH